MLSQEADTSCFKLIPQEIVYEVLNYLPVSEQKMARLVCQRWRELLDSNPKARSKFVFRAALKKDVSISPFLKSNVRFDRLTFQNISATSGLTSTKQPLPRIDGVNIEKNNSAIVLQALLTGGLSLCEYMQFGKLSLANLRGNQMEDILTNVNWEQLKHLVMHVSLTRYMYEKAKNHLKNVMTILKLGKIQNLEIFEMSFKYEYEPFGSELVGFQSLFETFYAFVAKHAKTLKNLSFCMERHRKSHAKTVPEIPHELRETISTDLKLKNLTLFFTGGAYVFTNFVTPTLLSGTNLKSIKLGTHEEPVDSIGLGVTLKEIIDLNANTLTEFILYSQHINLTWLVPCKFLETLQIIVSSVREPDTQLDCQDIQCLEFITMEDHFPSGIVRLIEQNVGTLKRLWVFALTRAFRSPGQDPTRLQICLDQEFPSLEYFSFVTRDSYEISNNFRSHFPKLIDCRLIVLRMAELTLMSNWMVTNSRMINLQTLIILIQPEVPCLQVLLSLPKLREIHFKCDHFVGTIPNVALIQSFCDVTPGITLEPSKFFKGFKVIRRLESFNIN